MPARSWGGAIAALVLGVACAEPMAPDRAGPMFGKSAGTSTVTVTAAVPDSATQDTTLDVQVQGSGFDQGSQVAMLLGTVPDSGVRTNSTKFVTATQLTANITIAVNAVPTKYSVQVTTSGGKKGVGSELFTILPLIVSSGLGGQAVWSLGVNGSGIVVGYSETGSTCGSGTETRPFVWTVANSIRELGLPAGDCWGTANAINSSNVIAGSVGTMPVRWLPDGNGGWQVHTVGGLVWRSASADGINEAGQLVGNALNATTAGAWFSPDGVGLQMLPLLPGLPNCTAQSINNVGQIAGNCFSTYQPRTVSQARAVVWSSPTATPIALPALPGATSGDGAMAINDQGVVVGSSGSNAVRWVPSGGTWVVQSLGVPVGSIRVTASGINQAGQIVGRWFTKSGERAFLWQSTTGIRDLGVAKSGQTADAYAINDPPPGGQLLVAGWVATGNQQSIAVWQPR